MIVEAATQNHAKGGFEIPARRPARHIGLTHSLLYLKLFWGKRKKLPADTNFPCTSTVFDSPSAAPLAGFFAQTGTLLRISRVVTAYGARL